MVASGLKKLAKENDMKIANGVAYGNLRGFAATLCEGSGWKQIVFTTTFTDPNGEEQLKKLADETDLERLFRVTDLDFFPNIIRIRFLDNPGTMKKMLSFLNWFIPEMEEHGAAGVNICTKCGGEITGGRWMLINGIAYHYHGSCAQGAAREIENKNTRRKEEDAGNYFMGLLGALGGSVIGAILWGIVLYLGYFASAMGLVIGILAEKGYNLLKGKRGKGKILILIVAIIFGVLVGTIGVYGYTMLEMVISGELAGFAIGDIPALLAALLIEDAEFRRSVISYILLGLMFAGLGVFALLRRAGKEISDETCIELE